MKIPRILTIGGHKIRVRCVNDQELINDAGDWSMWSQIIRINTDGSTEDGQADTLLHEIIEAINYFANLELTHIQISTLTTLLFAAIRQNSLTFLEE